MLNTIFKLLDTSLLDTVERVAAFAALVFFGAILIGVASFFALSTIQKQELEEFNIPFILERYSAPDTRQTGDL